MDRVYVTYHLQHGTPCTTVTYYSFFLCCKDYYASNKDYTPCGIEIHTAYHRLGIEMTS